MHLYVYPCSLEDNCLIANFIKSLYFVHSALKWHYSNKTNSPYDTKEIRNIYNQTLYMLLLLLFPEKVQIYSLCGFFYIVWTNFLLIEEKKYFSDIWFNWFYQNCKQNERNLVLIHGLPWPSNSWKIVPKNNKEPTVI